MSVIQSLCCEPCGKISVTLFTSNVRMNNMIKKRAFAMRNTGIGGIVAGLVFLVCCGTAFSATSLTHGIQWVRDHDFTIMGLVGNMEAYNMNNPLQYKEANMTAFMEWTTHNEYHLACNNTTGLPWFLHIAPHPDGLSDEVKSLAYRFTSMFPNNAGWYVWDEPAPYSYATVAQSINWFRQTFPNSLAYSNLGGGEFRDDPVGTIANYVNVVNPDVLMYDRYPYAWDGSTGNNFVHISAMRQKGLETGLPTWVWIQSFGNEDFGLRTPSESDLRREVYQHMTYGFKGISYFTYTPEVGQAMVNTDQTANQIYYDAQKLNSEVKVLGEAMKYLRSLEVCYVPGQHEEFFYKWWDPENPGVEIVKNDIPDGTYSWVPNSGADTAIESISVSGMGEDNNGLIGFFTDDEGQLYFMLTNLKNGPNLTAEQAALDFTIVFNDNITDEIFRLNAETGFVDMIPLVNNTVTLTLSGGTGELFKYYDGNFVNVELPFLPGDANGDGVVSAGDYASVQANFGNTGEPGLPGDANGDGVVSAGDYASVQANFGNTLASQNNSIPEPASLTVISFALVLFLKKQR